MIRLYNLFSTVALGLYLPKLFLKKGPADKRAFVAERLGISQYKKAGIWVHAVSVGEVIACVPFLKALKKEFPSEKIVLSTTTYTGQKVARERFPEADRIMYMPWDAWLCLRKAAAGISPRIFITIETELWPSLFRSLKKAGSTIIILNGRISARSYRGYRRLGFFMKDVLSHVDFFYMQGKGDAERIMGMGAERHRVGVMGNLKFDISIDESAQLDWLEQVPGRILLAASTHAGEEEIILQAYGTIKPHHPDLKLIIAPRHPERFKEAEEIIRKNNFMYIRRSMMDQGTEGYDIVLLDTIGELSRAFSKVTIAFIGGSLVPVGGHNILEPAYWGKPVLFGPYMDNFPFSQDFIHERAALRVSNADDISREVMILLDDSGKALQLGQNAKAIMEKNRGAVKKAIALVRGFIGNI